MFFSRSSIVAAAALAFSSLVSAQVDATVCANVVINVPRTQVSVTSLITVTVPAITLSELCLCADAGVLTDDSVADIRAAVQAKGLTGNILSAAINLADDIGLTNLQDQTDSCQYPSDGTSVCSSTACAFTCPDGGCSSCPSGTTLTDAGDGSGNIFTCQIVSASAARRRSALHARSFGACPFQQTACAVPGNAKRGIFARSGFECLDTRSNIESCGGCQFPLDGQAEGTDCTAIHAVDTVSCVNSACVISSCEKGYTKSSDGSECILSLLVQQ